MTDQSTSSTTPAPAPGAAPTFFVVRLTYTAALEEVDAVREDHRAHLRVAVQRGLIVAAGPQDPRTGGVIIARGARDELEAHLAADPYVTHGLVEVDITPFAAVTLAPALSA